jgi:hypothetical protein
MPIKDSWRRRGHAPDCWRIHEDCALKSAKDICDTRIAQARAQSLIFAGGIQKLSGGLDAAESVLLARRILLEYHRVMKSLARDEG